MGSVNKVILVGNLGRDAELRYTPGGAAVATINMATTEVWNDKAGQRQEKTEWHRVVLWGKSAESLAEYLTKGKQIYVEGRLQTRQWDDKDGNKRYTTEIRGDRVVLLGGGAAAAGAVRGCDVAQAARRRRHVGAAHRHAPSDVAEPLTDDDIPVLDAAYFRLSSPSVTIFEPHDVVQLGRRHFEDVAVLDRRHAMHGFRRDVDAFAGKHLALHKALAFLNLEQQLAGVQVDRFVLHVVVLKAERVAGVHVNQLADIALGLGPVQLVAPGLLDATDLARSVCGHLVTP